MKSFQRPTKRMRNLNVHCERIFDVINFFGKKMKKTTIHVFSLIPSAFVIFFNERVYQDILYNTDLKHVGSQKGFG